MVADSKRLPKAFSGYTLESLQELKDSLKMGMEVNFFMRGVWYLLEEKADGRAMVAVCPDGRGEMYNNWEELFDRHMIDGRPLGDQWKEFEIEMM